jgi:hypothetical protein
MNGARKKPGTGLALRNRAIERKPTQNAQKSSLALYQTR